MKVIISHDVDHLSYGEHWLRDAYIPKYLLRHTRYWSRGSICADLWWRRISTPFNGEPFHHLDKLLAMDREYGVPATYFIGMRRGLGMSYSRAAARGVIARLLDARVDVGVHGVEYTNAIGMREEFDAFRSMVPSGTDFGVRNHYLRRDENTLSLQAVAGYQFDSSEEGVRSPYMKDGIYEFPVCLMEVRILREDEAVGIGKAKSETERMVMEAERSAISHFTILFHDVYFSPLFPQHQAWYAWLIPWLRERFEWSNFRQACQSSK
jgi:hypothetical protein